MSKALPSPLDFRQLFKLRLVVAALGETQRLGWWTSGMLTVTGEFLFQLGFPRSAPFAQTRAGFRVAQLACDGALAIQPTPGDLITSHLFGLTPKQEDAFESERNSWLDDPREWAECFQGPWTLKTCPGQTIAGRGEEASGSEPFVSQGFSEVRPQAFSAPTDTEDPDYRIPIGDKSNIRNMLFGCFEKCLYSTQTFDGDPERRFASLLEKDRTALKWFKPGKGVFQIRYSGNNHYEPDFVVETETETLLCEPKRSDQPQDATVLAKASAAARWCSHASTHPLAHKGKPWRHLPIPHDEIADHRTLQGLAERFSFADQLKEPGQIEQLGAARGAKDRLTEQGRAVAESQSWIEGSWKAPSLQRRSAPMKRRNGIYNTKRQLADLCYWPPDRLEQLGQRLIYGGNPEHKRNPGDFGLTPPSGARKGKMLCDEVGIFHRQEALELLRSGVTTGLISQRCVNGWPQNIWAVRDGRVLEAQLEQSETGTYHGYPLQPEDPFAELVLQRLGDKP